MTNKRTIVPVALCAAAGLMALASADASAGGKIKSKEQIDAIINMNGKMAPVQETVKPTAKHKRWRLIKRRMSSKRRSR